MWTQEWSDIPSRSEPTCCMCHQALHLRIGGGAVDELLELAIAAGRDVEPDRGEALAQGGRLAGRAR